MGEEYFRTVDIRSLLKSGDRLLLYDDFSSGISFQVVATGADARAHISQDYRRNFSNSLLLRTRQTSSSPGDVVQATWYSDLRPCKFLTANLDFLITSISACQSLEFFFQSKFNSTVLIAGVKYDAQNAKWQYYSSSGSFLDVPGAYQNLSQLFWHRLSFSIDFILKEYYALTSSHQQFSLSSIPVQLSSGPPLWEFSFSILLYSNSSTPAQAYISNIYIVKS